MPLWPQLEGILREYVFGVRLHQPGRLLFPSFETGQEAMVTDVRKLLDRIAVRAGFLTPMIDTKTGEQRRKRSGELMWQGRSSGPGSSGTPTARPASRRWTGRAGERVHGPVRAGPWLG